MGEEDGGMEDLYKVLGFDGEWCIRRMPISHIFESCQDLFKQTMLDDLDSAAGICSAILRWAYAVMENPITRRTYDVRLAQTIRIRRAFAEKEIAESERRIAAASGKKVKSGEKSSIDELGVGEGAKSGEQSSIDELERRVAELAIEEKRLRKGPPRWRRRRRRGAFWGAEFDTTPNHDFRV